MSPPTVVFVQEHERARPRGQSPCVCQHQKYKFDAKSSVCYIAVTALAERFCQNALGPARPPPALCAPDNSSIGCADGGSATGALELPPLCLRATLRLRTASVMRNEHSGKYTPRPPLCPGCAQIMRIARITSRFGGLPDLYRFECRACGLSHLEAAYIEAA
jgi:hypothetical protein